MIDFVYIMSASHSGSTLLTLLLAGHPDVATVGETSAVSHRGEGDVGLCSCGAGVDACPFWQEVSRRLETRGLGGTLRHFETEFRLPGGGWTDRVLRAEYQRPALEVVRDMALAVSPAWRARSRELLSRNLALIEEVLALQGGKVFVDSSKEPHRLKFLLKLEPLRIKVIHLVRDGRGVMGSYLRRDSMTPEQAADEWRRSILSEEYILRRFRPDEVFALRYEDLCRNVEPTVKRILGFLGLTPDTWDSDFRVREHHVLGNRMRMQNSTEIKLDERWRQTLSGDHLRTFEEMAGQLNRKYGYT